MMSVCDVERVGTRVGQRRKRYFESVVHMRTDARFVALADDCRVEKLSCALEIISLLDPCFMSAVSYCGTAVHQNHSCTYRYEDPSVVNCTNPSGSQLM